MNIPLLFFEGFSGVVLYGASNESTLDGGAMFSLLLSLQNINMIPQTFNWICIGLTMFYIADTPSYSPSVLALISPPCGHKASAFPPPSAWSPVCFCCSHLESNSSSFVAQSTSVTCSLPAVRQRPTLLCSCERRCAALCGSPAP